MHHIFFTAVEPPVSHHPKRSNLGGRLREVIAYKRLDPNVLKFYPISICRDLPLVLNVLFMQKLNFDEKSCTFHWEISVSCITEVCDTVTTPLRAMLIGRLREVKNKRKFQTFSSESARGCLREAVAFKKFQLQ